MVSSFLKHLVLLLLAHGAASQVTVGNFVTRQHQVAGEVVALSDRVLEVRNFVFDGNAPAAFFWASAGAPSPSGRILLDGSPTLSCGQTKLPGADGSQTFIIEFPEGTSVLDYLGGTISVWCEAFDANFGEVTVPASLEGLASTSDGPTLECSEEPVPEFVATPDGYNCEPLNDDFQVRWQVTGQNLNVQLLGRIDDSVYMSFGVSGSDTMTQMVGCDAVVADVFDGEFRALDYYMDSQGQCSNGGGVCADIERNFTSDVSNVAGQQGADLTIITYTRPLTPTDTAGLVAGQTVDRAISTAAGVSSYIVWALGPIDSDSGLPFFHTIDYPRVDVTMEFGRAVQDNCEPLMELPDSDEEPEEVIPFFRPIMTDVTEFSAHIGPSAGERGYVSITGEDAWGISWYINDAIIPLVEMRRGTTYRFLVNGGDDPTLGSEYHPLYLTSSSEGGFAQFFPDQTETVYAGIDIISDGTAYQATAEGPLCSYQQTDDSQEAQDDGTNFPEFFSALDTTCSADTALTAAAGVLEFTPDANTPDLLYYQCVTHRSLGWEVHVIDADAPSMLEVDCSAFTANTVDLATGVTLNAIINPQTNTLQAELVYEGLAWVALAFTSGPNAGMIGSEAVIGLPDEDDSLTNPGKYNLGSFVVAGVTLMPDAQQTLMNATVVQNETHTVLSFTKLLVEEGEHPIDLENENRFLWAVGRSNVMGAHSGGGRGPKVVETAQCQVMFNGVVQNPNFLQQTVDEIVDNTETLWAAHGGCAAVAWAILVPLAIGSSIIRDTLQSMGLPPGAWFMLHRGLNTLALLLTICAFGIAVYIIGDQGRAHFSGGVHVTLGLIIFILTVLQALNGMFRPHVPAAAAPDTSDTKKEDDEEDAEEEAVVKEQEPKSQIRVIWEYGHRILGVVLLAMAWWQVQSGFGIFFERFGTDLRAAFWAVVGVITGVVAVVKIYQVMQKQN